MRDYQQQISKLQNQAIQPSIAEPATTKKQELNVGSTDVHQLIFFQNAVENRDWKELEQLLKPEHALIASVSHENSHLVTIY